MRRPDLAIFIVIFKLVRGKVALFVFSMSIVAEGDKVEGEVLEGAAQTAEGVEGMRAFDSRVKLKGFFSPFTQILGLIAKN